MLMRRKKNYYSQIILFLSLLALLYRLLLFYCLLTLHLPIRNFHGVITDGHLLGRTGILLLFMCLSRFCFSLPYNTIVLSLRSPLCGFLLLLDYAAWGPK